MKKLSCIFALMSVCMICSAQIDIHSHMIPDSYLEAVKAHGMEMDEGFPIPAWNVDAHLKFMDEAGIRTSVLTMPAPQPYFGDGAESARICRRFNEEAATLKALKVQERVNRERMDLLRDLIDETDFAIDDMS